MRKRVRERWRKFARAWLPSACVSDLYLRACVCAKCRRAGLRTYVNAKQFEKYRFSEHLHLKNHLIFRTIKIRPYNTQTHFTHILINSLSFSLPLSRAKVGEFADRYCCSRRCLGCGRVGSDCGFGRVVQAFPWPPECCKGCILQDLQWR